MSDRDDKPARYSDEANLEPTARASEVVPELSETELPEAGERVEVEDGEPAEFATTVCIGDARWEGTITIESIEREIGALQEIVNGSPAVVYTVPLTLFPDTAENYARFQSALARMLRRRGSGE